MNRALVVLVVAQAIVIVLLAIPSFEGEDRERQAVSRGAAETPEEGRPTKWTEGAPVASERKDPEPEAADVSAAPEYAVLHGRITSSAGGSLKPPVWINLTQPGSDPQYAQLQPDGYYAFAGIEPGKYRLEVTGTAYDDARIELELGRGEQRWDVELVAAMVIRILVETSEGKPLTKALVEKKIFLMGGVVAIATRQPLERLPLTELRGHSRYGLGNFRNAWELQMRNQPKLPEAVAGVLMAKAAAPFHVSLVFMHMVLASKQVTAPVEELSFVVDVDEITSRLATVKMRLLDATTGEPIRGRVSISDRQSGGGGLPAGEDGRLIYPNVPPGLKEFQVSAQGYEQLHTYIRIAEGGESDLGTLRLHKAVEVSGRVTDSEGKPISTGMIMRNLDRITFPQPLSHAMSHKSDAEGKFKMMGVGRGRILIGAGAKGHALTRVIVDTSGGGLDNVEIKLSKGTEVVLEPEPNRSRDYFLTIRRESVPYVTRWVRGTWPIKATLVPGRYTIEISEDGEVTRTLPLEVGKEPIVRSISER